MPGAKCGFQHRLTYLLHKRAYRLASRQQNNQYRLGFILADQRSVLACFLIRIFSLQFD